MEFVEIMGADPCTFKKGDCLIRMDEKLEYVYYLISGQVRREIITEYGVENILSDKTCGRGIQSVVGILYLYSEDGQDISQDNFIAATECACVRLPVQSLREYLRKRPLLLEEIIRLSMAESRQITNRYLNRVDRPLSLNFCAWLLHHLIEIEDTFYLPRKYTNIEISKHLGIHKVTVSRVFRALREAGVIEKTQCGQKILSMNRLEAYAYGIASLKY